MAKKCKYTWTAQEFDLWLKQQAASLRSVGFRSSTDGITRLLYHKVIVPNNIDLKQLVKPQIKIKWIKKRRAY